MRQKIIFECSNSEGEILNFLCNIFRRKPSPKNIFYHNKPLINYLFILKRIKMNVNIKCLMQKSKRIDKDKEFLEFVLKNLNLDYLHRVNQLKHS